MDGFVWLPHLDRHCLILHSIDTRRILLFMQAVDTGMILVKKGDKQNNLDVKLDMIRVLLEGHSVTYFPEGAWNLSPNKLVLPMSYGFLDVARKARVPVVPVVHEYTYDTSGEKENITKIHSRFGQPMTVSESDSLSDKLQEYIEAVSTIRWELMAEKGLYWRSSVTDRDYINYLKGNIRNLEFGKIDLNRERYYIFGAQDEFYRYHSVNDVPFDEERGVILTERMRA